MELVKVTLNLTEENWQTVQALSKDRDVNKTTVINQSILSLKFLADAKASGKKILVENEDGSLSQVIFEI